MEKDIPNDRYLPNKSFVFKDILKQVNIIRLSNVITTNTPTKPNSSDIIANIKSV